MSKEKKQDIKEHKLTTAELSEMLAKASEIYTNYGLMSNSYIANKTLVGLTDNPKVPSSDSLKTVFANYSNAENATLIQQYNEFSSVVDPLLSRAVEYYANLLSFDLSWSCKNDNMSNDDFNSQEYKDDCNRRNMLLDRLNIKQYFKDITKICLKRETCFVWIRDGKGSFQHKPLDIENDKNNVYSIQYMPQERCKLVGKNEFGYNWDFDMSYFMSNNVSIDGYDPIFKKYFDLVYDDNKNKPYNQYGNRSLIDNKSDYYVRTSPEDGGWVFKRDTSNNIEIPFLSNLLIDSLNANEIENLQKDKNMLSAMALLVGDLPLNNKQKSGSVSDSLALQPSTITSFLGLVNKGVRKNINATIMPAVGSKLYQYQDYNENMSNMSKKEFAGKTASASGLLYSTEKSNSMEIEAQIQNDFMVCAIMYAQFENFLNFFINKKMKKYKWSFSLSGTTQPTIRERQKKNLIEMASIGFVPNLSVWSSVLGIKPQDFERSLREARYGGLTDTLVSLSSIHTASGSTSEGRPESGEPTDSTVTSRDYK